MPPPPADLAEAELLEPAALSDITCRLTRHRARDGTAVHVLAFTGTYRYGSAGNPDAAVMRGQVAAALATWSVDALVHDLRALDYRWGDGLVGVFAIEAPDAIAAIGGAVVLGPRSRDGLRSLCAASALHDELGSAIEAAAAEARALAARDQVGDDLVLHVVVDEALGGVAIATAATRACIHLAEQYPRAWQVRAWRCGRLTTRIVTAPAARLVELRAERGTYPVRGADDRLAAVALLPSVEAPAGTAPLAGP